MFSPSAPPSTSTLGLKFTPRSPQNNPHRRLIPPSSISSVSSETMSPKRTGLHTQNVNTGISTGTSINTGTYVKPHVKIPSSEKKLAIPSALPSSKMLTPRPFSRFTESPVHARPRNNYEEKLELTEEEYEAMEGLRLIVGDLPGFKDVIVNSKRRVELETTEDEVERSVYDDSSPITDDIINNSNEEAEDPQLEQFLSNLSTCQNYYTRVIESMESHAPSTSTSVSSQLSDQNRIDYEKKFQAVNRANLTVANERLNEPNSTYLDQWPRQDKARVKKEIREMKALGRADHDHGNSEAIVSGANPYLRKKQAVELDLGILESKLNEPTKTPLTCSLVSCDYLTNNNYLYAHTLPDVEELKEHSIDERRRTTISGPKRIMGPRRKRGINGFEDALVTRKMMREVKRADDLDKFHDTNSKLCDIPCPGCGLPMHRHGLGEVLRIEEDVVEEYVRLNRRDGDGLFKGSRNWLRAKREADEREEGGGEEEEDSKVAKRMNAVLQKYEDVMREMSVEVLSPKSKNRNLSPFLKKGVGRSENKRFSMGRNAIASDLSEMEKLNEMEGGLNSSRRSISISNGSGHWALQSPNKPEEPSGGRRGRLRSVEFADDFKVDKVSSSPQPVKVEEKKSTMEKMKDSRDFKKKATVFSAESAKKLMGQGAKKVSKKKKMLYAKVKKEHERKMKKNEILRKIAEESKKHRNMMRKMRMLVEAERRRRDAACRKIGKNWKMHKVRRLARKEHLRKINFVADASVSRLMSRATKNVLHKLEMAKKKAANIGETRKKAAGQIQALWSGFKNMTGKKGRWTEMYLKRKMEKRAKLDKRKEEWSAKMIELAEAEWNQMRVMKEINEDTKLMNFFEKSLREEKFDLEQEEVRLAVEAEEKQRAARMRRIDMLEEKIHHTIGNTEVAGMIREKRRIKKRRFFEDEAKRSGGRGLVKYGGGVTFEEAAWIELEIFGSSMLNMDDQSRSDPFVVMQRRHAGGYMWEEIYRSECKMNTLKPLWEPFTLSLKAICERPLGIGEEEVRGHGGRDVGGRFYGAMETDPSKIEIRFQVFDWDFQPPNDFIGEVETTLFEVLNLGGSEDWLNLSPAGWIADQARLDGIALEKGKVRRIKVPPPCGCIKLRRARLLPKNEDLEFDLNSKSRSTGENARRRSKQMSPTFEDLGVDKITVEYENLKLRLGLGIDEDSLTSSSRSSSSGSSGSSGRSGSSSLSRNLSGGSLIDDDDDRDGLSDLDNDELIEIERMEGGLLIVE
ncbi:hypothetical protein TL16_g13094 [Triparma laevis f. inornata]|uniref:C2 domain-containing protein n=1 Tax=Triparma laevis f. inornata TaxID=1714386 RepID=A0A9W7EZ64_9STRA|nr:hypothetical protein TL16_g13094 [Triparma laevis f. inornata]